MSDVFWTLVVIVVAALLALMALRKKNNIIFALVVVRAFIGIIIKRVDVDPVYASSIIWTLGVCIAIIFAGI
jgi:H+/gluconate symporter-like permease